MRRCLPFFILVLFVCFSCSSDLVNQVRKISGSKISFDLTLTRMLNDSLNKEYRITADSTIKFVVLYDSTECSLCRINMLDQYNDIFDLANKIGAKFAPIIIFSPAARQIRDIKYDLRNSKFTYPIYLDLNHEFCKLNPQIPLDRRFHAFLLNQKNDVVLVGNPLNNPTMWSLYENTIKKLNNGSLD